MANHRWWTTKMGDLLCQLLEGTTITNDPSKWWIFHGIFHVYEVPGSFSIWFVLFASLGMDQLTQVWLKMGYHQWPWISFDPRFLPMNLGPHICISQQQTPLKLCRIYPMKYASILMAGMFRVSCLELFFNKSPVVTQRFGDWRGHWVMAAGLWIHVCSQWKWWRTMRFRSSLRWMGQRNPNHQLKTVVNITLFIVFQASFWWCRISPAHPQYVIRIFGPILGCLYFFYLCFPFVSSFPNSPSFDRWSLPVCHGFLHPWSLW